MLQLETDRLLLRAPVPEDAVALAPMYADPEVMRYVGDGRTLTRSETDRSVRRMIERWEADGFGLFTTVRKEDEAVVGRVGLLVWNTDTWEPTTRAEAANVPSEVEVGYTLGRDYWGRGYATEAATAVLAHAFGPLGLPEVVSFTVPANRRSRHVMERLGMTRSPADDFEHPGLPDGHPLRTHVLYRLSQSAWLTSQAGRSDQTAFPA